MNLHTIISLVWEGCFFVGFSCYMDWGSFICWVNNMEDVIAYASYLLQAVDVKLLGSLNRDDLKKICGDSYPEWISFPVYEQV